MISVITKGFKLSCIISFFFYLTVLHHVKVFFDFEGFDYAFGISICWCHAKSETKMNIDEQILFFENTKAIMSTKFISIYLFYVIF